MGNPSKVGLVFNLNGGSSDSIKLESLTVVKPPDKTIYKSGESFDPTGMVVEAGYRSGLTSEVTGYTASPAVLTDGITEVTITYTEGRVTRMTSIPITVEKVLTSIEVTTPPTKTIYNYLESFDPAGMVVTAAFSDGSTEPVTGYAYPSATFSTLGNQTVNLDYTYEGVTKGTHLVVAVDAIEMAVPTQKDALTYDSNSKSPAWDGYDPVKMALTGDTSGVDAGTYTVKFTLPYGYLFLNGASEVTVDWVIGKAVITAVPAQNGTLTYTGNPQSPTLSGYDPAKMTLDGTTTATNAGEHTASVTPTVNYQWDDGSTGAKSVTWKIGKAQRNLLVAVSSVSLTSKYKSYEVSTHGVNANEMSVTSSNPQVATAEILTPKSRIVYTGPDVLITGVSNGAAIIIITGEENENYLAVSKTVEVSVDLQEPIYGASWDGTSTTKWTRTDAAAGFTDPVPAVNNGSGSSPFDSIQPWAGMVKSNRTGGVMVAIPKFWYKITQNGAGMKVQIANKETSGFSVSPAHMNRGDGKGERDVVYIGRYHCGASAYKSATGQKPKASITRSAARTAIHNLGSNIWQMDFAMWFTIWLLYIVEFANWNSQAKIGYGCGDNSGTENMGYTDGMTYHTGTTKSSRTTYGCGTQYRNIEGLWDNVYDWMDGCYYNGNGMNIILNPNSFSDSSGGISIGTPSNGLPSAFGVKSVPGLFPTFIPTAERGSDSTYSCDYWYFSKSNPCLHVGGNYGQSTHRGLFCVNYVGISSVYGSIGCRLQELP